MDMYGISSAALHENELHAQIARQNEIQDVAYQASVKQFGQAKDKRAGKDDTSNDTKVVEGLGNLTKAGTVVKSTVGGVEAVARSGSDARAVAGFSGVAETRGASLTRGVRAFGQGAGEEFAGVDRTAEGVGAAVKGFSGIEDVTAGIIGKVAGVGDATKFVAGKAAGELGAVIDIAKDGSNLIETGNLFKSDDGPGGKAKEESGLDIAGDISTIFAGALDVAAVFSGGLLAPAAAAASLLAAGLSTAGAIEDEKAGDKTVDDSGPGPQQAPVEQKSIASYGFVGSQSHDPVSAISGGARTLF